MVGPAATLVFLLCLRPSSVRRRLLLEFPKTFNGFRGADGAQGLDCLTTKRPLILLEFPRRQFQGERPVEVGGGLQDGGLRADFSVVVETACLLNGAGDRQPQEKRTENGSTRLVRGVELFPYYR